MRKLITAMMASIAIACTVEQPEGLVSPLTEQNLTITASWGDPETRTERAADGAVLWSPGDQISLFYGSGDNGGSCFTGQNTEPSKVVNFTGKIGVITGGNDVAVEDTYFWAVYPYTPTACCDGSSITTVLPSSQAAQADTFADDLFPSVGRSQGLVMGFYNICGGLKFTVSEEGIKSVTLQGRNNEIIAGRMTVGFNDAGQPVVQSVAEGSESITVSAPAGEAFEVGRAYYIVLVPTVFENGFTLTFSKGYARATYDRTKKTIIRRSAFGGLTTPDAGLEWEMLCVPIPDANFKAYMIQNFDTNGNGELDFDEAEAVTRIVVNTNNIESVEGIEYCKNLERLTCRGTKTIWSEAEQRYIGSGQLSYLDVSQNTVLTHLSCGGNQLTSLDVSQNTALTDLICYYNRLTSLDVSANTALTSLSCYRNQLTSLDVSANTALSVLDCSFNQLTSLEVSQNAALQSLSCYYNQLTNLDLSQSTSLQSLSCYYNQLTNLDLSQSTSLQTLSCYNNQLTSLDVSQNTALTDLICYYNRLTSLDVSANTALTSLSCFRNQLTSLDVSANTALTSLSCGGNQLTSLDVSANTALTSLSCDDNQLTSLDVSQNTALTDLICDYNRLTSLDVGTNTALTSLSCGGNQLTSLDMSANTALTSLSCSTNRLASLDVSKNTALAKLDCSPMNNSFGQNLLGCLFVAQGQTIPYVTTNRSFNYVPAETAIVVIPKDGELESPIDESLDGNVIEENFLEANGAVLFEDDFEWLSPWAYASGAGDTIGTNEPSTTAPNVFTNSNCEGFMDEFSSRGYTYLWGSPNSGGWSDSLGDDNPRVMYIQSNYLKFGKTGYNAAIKLPALENVTTTVDAVLSFDWAWQITASSRPDIMTLSIDIDGGGAYLGNMIESSQPRYDNTSELVWQHTKVLLSGIKSGSRITIRPTNYNPEVSNPSRRQNRWFLDNIKVVSK